MVYRIVVCDDDKVYADKTGQFIQAYCKRNKISVSLDIFYESGPVLDAVESRKNYDLCILDIEMRKFSGLEIAKRIKETEPKTLVILLTAHIEFAVAGYDLNVFRYIPKTDFANRMEAALEAAFDWLAFQEGKFYFIRNSRRFEKIAYNEICYMYKKQKNTMIFTESGEEIPVRKTLAEIYKELNSDEFIYIDRCYIINILKVKRIDGRKVFLPCGVTLNMSIAHSAQTRKQINQFWGDRV